MLHRYSVAAVSLLGGSLLMGCTAVGEDATATVDSTLAPLVGADDVDAIPGRYIVRFRDDVAAASMAAVMNRTALDTSSRVQQTYAVIPGFAGHLTDAAVARLRKDPSVLYIEQDRIIRVSAVQPSARPGLDRLDQRQGHDGEYDDYDLPGAGVHIYIVDTGIRTTHEEFTGRIGAGTSTISDGRGVEDCHGHGTHVASSAAGSEYGVAKGATVHPVRVLDCTGAGRLSGLIGGMDFVRSNCASQNGRCVANLSLGGGISQALDEAVASTVAANIPVAVAAGNENQNACNVSPARTPTAITVGAVGDDDARATFSNHGSCVDIFAPGVHVLGAGMGSDSATMRISGTSMATPHVTGAIAQYLQATPNATPAEVEAAMKNAGTPGCVGNAGTGSPNLLLFNDFDQPGADHGCTGDPDDPNSCNGFCGEQAPGGCFCDDVCRHYKDCCPDHRQRC